MAGRSLAALLGGMTVIPVLVIDRAEDGEPVAEALLAGGLTALEITLRTPAGAEAARRIVRRFPEALVGLGTLTQPDHFALAVDVGARFAVSPGLTPRLVAAAAHVALPYIPGVATTSELMLAREADLHELKFFPAVPAGGSATLAAWGAVLPDIRFCPTGGIGPENLQDFARLPNVFAIGGSWLAGAALIRERRWDAIRQRAQAASRALHGGTVDA